MCCEHLAAEICLVRQGICGKEWQTEADGGAVGPDCTHSELFDKLQLEQSKPHSTSTAHFSAFSNINLYFLRQILMK